MGRYSVIGRELITIFFSNLGYFLGMMIVNPLFPLYLQDVGANATEISLVLMSSGIVSTIFMAASPMFSEKYGVRRVMLVSTAISIFSQIVFSIIGRWEQAILWAIIFNAAWATRITAQIMFITEHTKSGAFGRVFGFMNLAFPLSNIAGPLLGGYLADLWGWNYTFYMSASMFLFCMVPLMLIEDVDTRSSESSDENTYLELFRINGLRRTMVVFSLSQYLITTGIGLVNLVIPLFLTSEFGMTKAMVGLYFSIGSGVSILLAQIPSGRLTDRYGGKRIMLPFLIVIPIAMAVYPFATNFYSLLALFMVISGFHSATWPASMSYIVNLVPSSMRSVAIGIRQTMIRLGFTVGPFIGGLLWEYYGSHISFYVASAIIALSAILILIISEKPKISDVS